MDSIQYYLNAEEIREIHSAIVISAGVKGEIHNGLDSLCQSAEYYHDDQTLEGVAAFYLSRIAKGHSFSDGNKRTAYLAARYFLMRNGADFNGTDAEEAADEMERIAAAPNGEAYELAYQLVSHYITKNQIVIPDWVTFERIVLKSIKVSHILSQR